MIAINFRLSKKCFVFIFLLFIFPVSIQAQSASVDTVNFYSVALQKITKVVVVLPSGYNKNKKYPVLFLLHGYTGNYSNWITKVPALKKYTCKTEMIVVCPDGENSWYVNDPSGIKNQYEKYISKELVEMIDKKYATYKSSVKRAITGLSMGGHGALTIAAKHPDVFGAAGSMSGAVDMMALQKNIILII